jgi:hypothetical protein
MAQVLGAVARVKLAGDSDGGATLRAELAALGPVCCKVGQTLATRPDIVGVDLSRNLGLGPYPCALRVCVCVCATVCVCVLWTHTHQVVGRLVEEEDVSVLQNGSAERKLHLPSARQAGDVGVDHKLSPLLIPYTRTHAGQLQDAINPEATPDIAMRTLRAHLEQQKQLFAGSATQQEPAMTDSVEESIEIGASPGVCYQVAQARV